MEPRRAAQVMGSPVRLFVEPDRLAPGPLALTGGDRRYLLDVLRLRIGARLTVLDGAGRHAQAQLVSASAERAVVEVGPVRRAPVTDRCRVTMLVALIKGDRMDWCVQKLVELGVAAIAPVRTARTVVRLDGARAERRRERLAAIATDAARQCRRVDVPRVHAIADLRDVLEARDAPELDGARDADAAPDCAPDAAAAPLRLIATTAARGGGLADALPPVLPRSVRVLIGPEGGFTDDEVAAAEAAGFRAISLGPRVLRAETAAVAIASIVAFAAGDLGASWARLSDAPESAENTSENP